MKIVKLVSSLIISFSAAALGGLATTPSIPTWYASLEKPFFNPPNWVFGPVWTVLYTFIGVSLYLVWIKQTPGSKELACGVFGLQMALNALWSIVFFGLHLPWLGLVVIISLDIIVLYMIKVFRTHSKLASNLLLPYFAWITFATVLNLAIAILN